MPGYTSELYNYISSIDKTFKNDVSFDQFKSKMADRNYSKTMYNWIGKNDNTFQSDVSFDQFREKLGYKKKSSTESLSQPQGKSTTSATVKTTTQKPSVSSGGKKTDYEIQMFTGFPGKEGKQYALDKSSAIPVWREKSNVGYDKAITDPARVDALNKHFKQKASSSEMEQVFTGFPEKEFNEYRVRDGKWERRSKGTTSWQTVINEGSILGLNKQFKQNVEVTKDIEKAKIDQKREIDNKKNLNKLLSSVNSNLVGSSEEYASEELEKKFPGFKFIQQGLGTDNLLVIAPNKNRVNISLDNFTDSDDRSQSTVLREFIRNNSDEEMAAAERELSFAEREKERFLERSEKEMFENDIPSEFKFVNGKLVIDTYVDKQKKTKQYGAIEDKLKENRKKYIDKKEEQFDDIYYRFKNQPYEPNKMEAAYASVRKDDAEIKRVNDYINDVRNTSKDIASEKTKIEEEMNDLVVKLRSGEITREQYNAEYKPAIEEKLLDLKNRGNQLANEIGNINVVNKAVDESIAKNFIIDESKGSFGGGMASKFVKGLTYIPRIAAAGSMSKKEQNDLVDLITGKGTTQEYTESSDRSDLVKSLFSLSESMGALTAGAALGGGAATYASFYAQSYYEMKDELDEIKGMTDAEKVLMSSVYGSLSSVLEKFGVDMITQKTPIGRNLKNNILTRMFSDLPKGASKEFIDAAMLNSVKMTLANAGLNAVGGAVGEGVTESLQSLSSVGIKQVYDELNDTEYFNNKSGWEILSDVMYEGYLGALGGGVMSTAATSPSVIKNGLLNAVNKEQAELLVNAAKTEGVDQALITNLKASILKGNITKEEAKVIADSFNEIKGKIQSMPDNLSISDKSVALDLMVEKDKIEKEIAGKDENLVAAQKSRITEINNQLKTISENAVQKQAAGEVPVQPGSEVSGEMAQGEPQAEPQIVTEEGQAVDQEEVVEPTEEEIDLESKLAEDLGMIKSETKPRLRVEGIDIPAEEDIDIESIETNLDKLPAYEANFVTPTLSQDIQVNPIEESKSQVKEGTAETRTIESFEGIPMVVGMSDTLAAGKVVDSVGNTMDVEGGLLYNVIGKNKNAAWAGVTKEGAQTQYNEALELYNNNKNLFDKLWAEGKLPNGHVPMAIMRMADTAVNSNEAVFRYLAPLVKSQPEQNQRAALEALKGDINVKKKVSQEATVKSANKLDEFISSNNIDSLGQLFDMIVIDANNRAKGDVKNTLSLSERSLLFDLMISQQGIKTASKNTVNALFGAKNDPKSKAFLADTIYNDISEPSMMKTPKGNVVSVVGIDVLNGGVIPVEHGNYGFGPKGQIIALISNPKHGLDVFPEWKAKATRVFKENKKGEIPSEQKIGDEVGGAFFIDKAFRGAKVSMDTNDIELLSAKLRFAFPDVAVSNSKDEFDRVLQEEGVRTKESEGKVILGMTKDGKIYLNPESDSLATPIHEFGHIWIDFLRSNASGKKGNALLSKGLSLVEGTKALQQAIDKYGDNDLAREEALVELIATKGETIINESKKKQFKNWLNALFKYVKNFFVTSEEIFKDKKFNEYLDKMSLDDFINTGLADLFKGEALSPKFKAKEAGKGAAELRFRVGDNVQNFINKARDNGYSDSAIKNVLIRNGVTKEDVETALGKYKKELNEVIAKAKEKYDLSIDRGNTEQKARESAMADLKKNDWYVNANDKQREEVVRELTSSLGGKIKKAPSVAKVLGKPTPKKVLVNEATALKSQLRLEAKAAREAQVDLKRKQRMIVAAVNNMKRQGTITANQASTLAKKIVYLNVDNPVMVDRFLQYAERLFKNAEYQNILSNAQKVRKSIKNFMKNNQANVVAMAKDFTRVNPAMVDDIDAYVENANAVLNAVKRSKDDTNFAIKNAADIDAINTYTEDMLQKQEEQLKNEKLKEYQDLVDLGVIDGSMTLKEINEIIKAIEEESVTDREKKETELRRFLNTRFDRYSTIIKDMLKTKVDPFTGDEVEVSEKDRDVLKRLMNVKLDAMSVKNAYTIVESMDNFIVNGITDGLDGAISTYEGDVAAKEARAEGIKAKKLRLYFSPVVGRAWYENFATLPVLFDSMFLGVKSGMSIMKKMGFDLLSNGTAKAINIYNKAINEYGETFAKKRPNDQAFNTSYNAYERGMLAYLKRTVPGNERAQKAELKRRIGLIKESINTLNEYGNNDQLKMAELYQEVFDKLGLSDGDVTIEQIESNTDSINADAVNWWIDQWSKHYSELYDVSLSVYNTKLGKDINYTTDRLSRVDGERELVDEATGKVGAFALDLGLVSYKDKAGVLMESNKDFRSLDTGKKSTTRFVNLDFDMSNAGSLKSALIDVNTASAIRRVDAFLNSRSYEKLFQEEKDAKLLKRRVENYILRYKNKMSFSDATLGDLDKFLDISASVGATRALGGPSQAALQTVPVFISTMINAGVGNIDFAGMVSDTDFHSWLNNSGYAIANRGMDASTAIESANKYLDKAPNTKGKVALEYARKINEFWLKKFLSQPDVWIARNAWKSYYTQSLKEQKLYNGNIDWKTHELNKEAADYAEHMVARQQNVSDAAMMGDFMNSPQPIKKIVRKVVLPFANFIMNQKTRLQSDLRTVRNTELSTKEDIRKAWRSLSGLAAEITAYNVIAYSLKLYVYDAIAASLTGYEEDEEEKEKNKRNRKKFVLQNLVKDVFSPLPVTDGLTIQGFNAIADFVQEKTASQEDINQAVEERNLYLENRGEDPMTEKEKEKFIKEFVDSQKMVFEEYGTKQWIDLGTATIAIDKAKELYDMIAMTTTGKFEKEFKGNKVEKVILPEDKTAMGIATTFSALYNLGLLSREFNSVATSMKKYVQKKAMSEDQLEDYKTIKKETGDVDGYKMDLLKSKMKIDNVLEEIDWVESKGGLTKEQSVEYSKLRKIQGEVYADDLTKIKKGMKAEKIYK
jgi:hypothetical protein